MKPLLDDRLAPITSEIGFFEAPLEVVLSTFLNWQSSIMSPLGVRVREQPVSGSLDQVLLKLLPLTSHRSRRYLFIPTAGDWVAFFDNSWTGTDFSSAGSYLARELSVRALRICAIPDSVSKDQKSGRFGACIFELFGPGGGPLGHLRSIVLSNDGGSWVFEQFGDPLPFEHLDHYSRRKIRDRFTGEDLEEYAEALGVRPFTESFYQPEKAHLVELLGPKPSGMKEYTLEEARSRF